MNENKKANTLQLLKPYFFIILFISIPVILFKWFKLSQNQEGDRIIENAMASNQYGLVIHGGAGNFTKNDIPDSLEFLYRESLRFALQRGDSSLRAGDSALKVVEVVINYLEDNELFNAGKGAVFTHDGINELDASVMDGKTMNAGAVAGVRTIKNPVSLAVKVMKNSEHVMLSGRGAEEFAREQGVKEVEPSYFFTQKCYNGLQKALLKEKGKKFGTVGCVVLDKYGNLAAGTSTGGMTNKRYGRIGDSPIVGAGTYADNRSCAVSCTGHGEFFIRYAVAHDISSRVSYLDEPLDTAARTVLRQLKDVQGFGGAIAIDNNANISMAFNTTGMFRGFCINSDKPSVMLFDDEE